MEKDTPLLVIIGPTAIGKTSLSLRIAEAFSCEIIGVDSMQIYRYMDIGTAKPTPDERAVCPHHLIDIICPDEDYTAGRFVADAGASINKIKSHNNIPLLVGGAGLYLKALFGGLFDSVPADHEIRSNLKKRLEGEGREKLFSELKSFDPVSAEKIHINDTQRLLRALEI